mgnify:CR=1 FL=1
MEALGIKEFYPIWKKYRPVILKLMVDAIDGTPQSYKLSKHEFTDANSRKSSTYTFKVITENTRNLKPTKASIVGSDFIAMLQQSGTAVELMQVHQFTFAMDNQFNFSVSAEPLETEEEAPAEEIE